MSEESNNVRTTLDRVIKIAGAIRENAPDAEKVCLVITLPDRKTLNSIDRELYVDSNGNDEGFSAGDEVNVTIGGIEITLKI